MTYDEFVKKYNFNSHAHVERDRAKGQLAISSINFNSHAHVERDHFVGYWRFHVVYFNSHAHVERDITQWSNATNAEISTHTLTWSVTG